MSRNIYLCVGPNLYEDSENAKRLLSDLGKPTRRGVRKCHKCGTYTGTRGLICKNKKCNAVFKGNSEKRKGNLEAIKLVTATTRKVYSVRVRDRGPDYRGFVQLPLINTSTEVLDESFRSQVALCFVDTCQRLFDISILKCHESDQRNNVTSTCVHIESALRSCNIGMPLDFRNDVLNLLEVPEPVKCKLWTLASEMEGPVVQRVSKMTMAVKCQVTPKHPLGYLHFHLYVSKGKEVCDRYYCTCNDVMISMNDINERGRCIHYYACVCALASNSTLINEFLSFIRLEIDTNSLPTFQTEADEAPLQWPDHTTNTSNLQANNTTKLKSTTQKKKSNADKHLKHPTKKLFPKITITETFDTSNMWGFLEWLSSVTESINQKLGLPFQEVEPLVFHTPKKFFSLLKLRIPCECSNVEVRSSTDSSDPKKQATVYKYSWFLHSTEQVRAVFNTAAVKVQTSQVFVQKKGVEVRKGTRKASYLVRFLCVNNDKEDASPFIIEWLPNIVSLTEFGQLRLEFNVQQRMNVQFAANVRM